MKAMPSLCLLLVVLCSATVFSQQIPPRRLVQPQVDSFVSNQKPGSILVFPYFVTPSETSSTQISVNNLHLRTAIKLKVFHVHVTGTVVPSEITVDAFSSAEIPLPDGLGDRAAGFVVAVAVDEAGIPVSFNNLIGFEYVKRSDSNMGLLYADAYPALFSGTLPGANPNATEVMLPLDGFTYGMSVAEMAVGDIPLTPGSSTTIVVCTLPRTLRSEAGTSVRKTQFMLISKDAISTPNVSTRVQTSLILNADLKAALFRTATGKGVLSVRADNASSDYAPNPGLAGAVLTNDPSQVVSAAYSIHHTVYRPAYVIMPLR